MPAHIANYSRVLKSSGGNRYALAPHAEQVRNNFLRQNYLVGLQAIVAEKKPAAKPLLERMQAVADGGLRNMRNQRLRITEQNVLQRAAPRKFVLNNFRFDAERAARNLHDGLIGRGFAAHKQGDSQHAASARHSHLGGRAVGCNVKKRNNRGRRKIEIRRLVARMVNKFAATQLNEFKRRQQPFVIFIG